RKAFAGAQGLVSDRAMFQRPASERGEALVSHVLARDPSCGTMVPAQRGELRTGEGLNMPQTVTANYAKGTSVICKGCHQRKIFVEGQLAVTVDNGERYLTLKCPLPTCG